MFIKADIRFSTSENSFPDRIIAALTLIGCEGIQESENRIDGYFRAEHFSDKTLQDVLNPFFKEDKSLQLEIKPVPDVNWNAEWERNFAPVVITKDCRVRATFHHFKDPCLYDIIIDPKMAFGTGHHATTYLMIQELLKLDITGKKLIDAGTGTGVLSVLASMRGAAEVVACDIDEHAVENARDNFKLNRSKNITLIEGSVSQIPDEDFDGILANINKNVLVQEMKQYAEHLKRSGFLLCSGFLAEDSDDIIKEAGLNSFTYGHSVTREGWSAIYFFRNL